MAKQFKSLNHNKKLIIGVAVVAVILFAIFSSQIMVVAGRTLAALNSGAIFSTGLTHEENVWLSALEWCESRGLKTAVNLKDRDGTPSYYSFQFKPYTFKLYGIRYGLLNSDVSDQEVKTKMGDYELQKKMVSLMFDDPKVNWKQEFPDCVRRLGLPPIKK